MDKIRKQECASTAEKRGVVVNFTRCAYNEYYTNGFENLAVKFMDFLLYPKWTDVSPCLGLFNL